MFRFRYKTLGGHTHVRVWAGADGSFRKCGELVFKEEEWAVFVATFKALNCARIKSGDIQIVPEDD